MSRVDGPAVGMTTGDHSQTRTFAGRGVAAMREDEGLSFRERFEKDVRDLRNLFGSEYFDGIAEARRYARTLPEYNA